MGDPTTLDGRPIQGGAAQPVVMMNQTMPAPQQGTAGVPAGGVQSVQGVTGGTPVSGAPSASALTDRSASLTTAGTAQPLAAANTSRKFLSLENLDTTNGLWYSLVGTAAASTIGSRYLGPGDAIAIMIGAFVPSNALSVVGTVNSQKVTCWEG